MVAVVTGASRGIGRATALALAREGAHVVCAARSSRERPSRFPGTIEDTAREVEALGRRALAVPCDVASDEDVARLARLTLEAFGRVDILVNNAGISYRATFIDTPMERWDRVLNVNLRGTVLCTKAFLPAMLEQGEGRIVNISSQGAVVETAVPLRLLSYSVAKAAIEHLTRGLALELQARGVAVNCLRIERSVVTEGWTYHNPDQDYSTWERPETAAAIIAWLCSRPLSFTGRVLTMEETRQLMEGE